jgi:hypothetical protein
MSTKLHPEGFDPRSWHRDKGAAYRHYATVEPQPIPTPPRSPNARKSPIAGKAQGVLPRADVCQGEAASAKANYLEHRIARRRTRVIRELVRINADLRELDQLLDHIIVETGKEGLENE